MYHLYEDGRLVFIGANPAADEILKLDNMQYVGQTIEEAFPALTETELPDRYRKVASQGESWNWDQVIYEDEKIEGAYEVHAFQISPMYMVATFSDITDRLKTEEQLKKMSMDLEKEVEQTTKQLQESEEKYRKTLLSS